MHAWLEVGRLVREGFLPERTLHGNSRLSSSHQQTYQRHWAGEEADGALHFPILKRFTRLEGAGSHPENRTWGCANTCGRGPGAGGSGAGGAGGRVFPVTRPSGMRPPHGPCHLETVPTSSALTLQGQSPLCLSPSQGPPSGLPAGLYSDHRFLPDQAKTENAN